MMTFIVHGLNWARRRLNMTIKQAAFQLRIHESELLKLETNEKEKENVIVSTPMVFRLCNIYGQPPDYFIKSKDDCIEQKD